MEKNKYIVREVGGMHGEWSNDVEVVNGLEKVVELLRKMIGGDEMDGDNWVESINKESDWEMFCDEYLWGNECFEVVKVG